MPKTSAAPPGLNHFVARVAVVHPGSWPAHSGRWVVDLIECDVHTANAAVRVALGQAHAITNKTKP